MRKFNSSPAAGIKIIAIASAVILSAAFIFLFLIALTTEDEKELTMLLDLAGRQRMLNRQHMEQILLTEMGTQADYAFTRKIINETMEALLNGGEVTINIHTGLTAQVSYPFPDDIKKSLIDEKTLFREFETKADEFLLLDKNDPLYRQRLNSLVTLNDRTLAAADLSVTLIVKHAEKLLATQALWERIVSISLLLIGIVMFFFFYRFTRLNRGLEEQNARHSAILNNTVDGIITINDHAIVQSFNPAAERIFGYRAADVIGHNVNMLQPEPYHSHHDEYVRNYLRTGRKKIIGIGREVVGKRKDGTTFPLDLAVSEVRIESGRLFTGIIRDITERKLAEEKLARQAMEAKLLQGATDIASGSELIDEAYQKCLDLLCQTIGWPVGHVYQLAEDGSGELDPTAIWHLRDPEESRVFREVTERTRFAPGIGLPGRILSSGEPAWIVDVREDPNFPRAKLADDIGVRGAFGFPVKIKGTTHAVLEFFSTEKMEPDNALLTIMRRVGDQMGRVLERKLTADNLKESEERYRDLFENANDLIQSVDPVGKFLFVNRAWLGTFGYDEKEIQGMSMFDIIHPDSRDHCMNLFERVMAGELLDKV